MKLPCETGASKTVSAGEEVRRCQFALREGVEGRIRVCFHFFYLRLSPSTEFIGNG